MGQTFDLQVGFAAGLQLFDQLLGDRRHMPVRPAASDHHLVGKRRLAIEVESDDLNGFGVIQAFKN